MKSITYAPEKVRRQSRSLRHLPSRRVLLIRLRPDFSVVFGGYASGAINRHWAVIASLIKTCKINGVDPHSWLTATLTAFVRGQKQSQINDLLSWNYALTV